MTVSTLPLDGILSSSKKETQFDALSPGFVRDIGMVFNETRTCRWPGSLRNHTKSTALGEYLLDPDCEFVRLVF